MHITHPEFKISGSNDKGMCLDLSSFFFFFCLKQNVPFCLRLSSPSTVTWWTSNKNVKLIVLS